MMVWHANTHYHTIELKTMKRECEMVRGGTLKNPEIQYNYEKKKQTNTRLLTIPNTRSRREEKAEKLRNTFRKYTKTYNGRTHIIQEQQQHQPQTAET